MALSRLEQEKVALQKKQSRRAVTADQVVGERSAEAEREMDELRRRNSELETEIYNIKYVLIRRLFCFLSWDANMWLIKSVCFIK